MKAVSLSVLLLMSGVTLDSQPKPVVPLRLSHALSPGPARSSSTQSYRDTVRVLALMVDFPASSSSKITGTGKFMADQNPNCIDPPPHDQLYFSYKMQFVQNYFRKVSNGKLTVVGTVLSRVVTASQQLQVYAPVSGDNNKPLADLAAESWRLADSAYPGFAFNQYDAFVVFHAGVGHDINIANVIGFDPTPYDLPSLYLGPQAFKDAFQDQSYAGISVSGGTFKIDNTIILPETDSHFFTDSQGGHDTIQVSINGLFAASIGSYLGLPDLWNTKTGQEGIGQYGLEDGASFFAFYGLFPPEPCAWEKIRLGWVVPFTISTSTLNLSAPAVGLYHTGSTFFGQDTIYKIPITDKEYFLVENRSRDPQENGQTLKIVQNGIVVSKTILADSTGFNNNDISAIRGSVVDVQDYDWGMIGGIDSTHIFDGGGILIWHVDENVIDAGLATNTVNANSTVRGIYLEEAKGAQDIGQSYAYLEGGYGSTSGDSFDPWFLGNHYSPTYSNVFDRNSIPNSNSNSGGYSLVTIKDFSPRLPRMTFSVQFGDDYLKPVSGFPKPIGASASGVSVQTWTNGMYVSKGDSVYVFKSDGTSGTPDATGLLTATGGTYPLAFDPAVPSAYFVGAKDSSLILIRVVDVNADGAYDSVQTTFLNVGHRITTAPVVSGTDVIVGHADGGIVRLIPTTKQISDLTTGVGSAVRQVVLPDIAVSGTGLRNSAGKTYQFTDPFNGFAVGGQRGVLFLVDTTRRSVTMFNSDLTVRAGASLSGLTGSITQPTAGDFLLSGDDDIIITVGNSLVALNSKGYFLDGFPVRIVADAGTASPPLLRTLNSASSTDVLVVSSTGLISSYNNRGKTISGFPIWIGTSAHSAPASFAYALPSAVSQTGISVMGDDGKLYAYQVSVVYVPVDTTLTVPISAEFLPASRVYNWPNPVYGNSTHIRFYSVQDASVTIRIFDIAGTKVAELSGKASAGIDSEVTWDVSNVQSGIYLARVEASNQNQTQARFIKIAVVK